MPNLYLVPIEIVGEARGPKYFQFGIGGIHPGITCQWAMMDYGFLPCALLAAFDIAPADHTALIANADVFYFPDNLDGPVNDPAVDDFFESVNLPTDWLTPSTTWRELLRQVAGMMQFNQRYGGISGGHSIFENATLDSRLRNMTAQEQAWFRATVTRFGYDGNAVSANSRLRLLVKQAGNYWIGVPFYLGGYEL